MVTKEAVLQTVQKLPDSASWNDITNALLGLAASQGSMAEFVQLYRGQITPEAIEEYLHPQFDVSLGEMIEKLERRQTERNGS